jgi:signal transduction histidine kinase
MFDNLMFLENLDYSLSDIFLTEERLWEKVNSILKAIVEKLELSSSVIYISESEYYQQLEIRARAPEFHSPPKTLIVKSLDEIYSASSLGKGILLPSKTLYFNWLTERHINDIFLANEAVLYSQIVFAGKIIVVGFGFKENIRLSRIEKIVLKESVIRLIRFIHNALSALELDKIMAETGHMLRRATGRLKAGVTALQNSYEYQSNPVIDENEICKFKNTAHVAINSGLFRLDNIINNHYAFSALRKVNIKDKNITKDKSYQQEINLIKLIQDIEFKFKDDLEMDKKIIKYDININPCIIKSNENLINILFINLIDNAIKYSYDDKFISIQFNKIGSFYVVSITNLGVGIAKDEYELVFERYYQSRYRDTSKRREGTGYGLALAKKIMTILFHQSSIKIESNPSRQKYGERRFDGDNYVTTITLKFPIEN